MRRRHWLMALALLAAGCSSGAKKSKKSSRSRSSSGQSRSSTPSRKRLNKGPQGFGDMLVDGHVDDLKSGSAEKKVRAAQELGKLGSSARSALPELERLAGDKNPQVSAAAKSAIGAIKKR